MYQAIEAVLDEHVRPLLRGHGGDMEVLDVSDGIVRFRMKGHCSGCPAAALTTESLIQAELTQRLPEIRQAVLVQETSPQLIDEARAILRQRHGG